MEILAVLLISATQTYTLALPWLVAIRSSVQWDLNPHPLLLGSPSMMFTRDIMLFISLKGITEPHWDNLAYGEDKW